MGSGEYTPGGVGGGRTTGGSDGGYVGGASEHRSFADNLPSLTEKYPVREGYFGTPASEKNTSTRHIESDDPTATAHDFYDRIAYGGVEEPLPNYRNEGKGVRTELSDGTIIVFRDQSNSPDKSPALRIDVTRSDESGDIKTQHIHFVLGGEDADN